MRLALGLVVAALLAPAAAGAAGETSIFYYPWWGTPKRDGSYVHWNQRGHAPPDDLASTFYPARGAYSSADWQVLRSHMKDIAGAGIKEVVSSWWGTGSPEDRRLPFVMRAAWKDKLDVAVQVEPYEKWRRTAKVLADDLGHLRELGIQRVYVYRPFDGLIDDASWRDLTRQFADLEVYAQTDDPQRAATDGFRGVYTYDIFGVRGGAFTSLCARAHAAGIACAPSVGPGFNAERATGDERIRRRRAGRTYDGMWRAAIAAEPDRVTITSYNEWHEGTQIEPARQLPPTIYGAYESYEGSYGKTGGPAQRAYLARTAYWTKTYRVAVAASNGARAVASLFSP